MSLSTDPKNMLRYLPGVDVILQRCQRDEDLDSVPKGVMLDAIRKAIEEIRSVIMEKSIDTNQVEDLTAFIHSQVYLKSKNHIKEKMQSNLINTINATGVVVHTNLGRSLLAMDAILNLQQIAGRYSNLEFDLAAGKRGSRYSCVEEILCELTGAEAAMVVNNNAGAVLLCLETLAHGKEVIVSRGELVEIGGAFRIPDVMARSGCLLKEVGTTNRTHAFDYENAITQQTALLLKVHKSNYSVVGFTAEVDLKNLVKIGKTHELPVMEDLGSGTLIDFSKYGLLYEPTVQDSIKNGADVVTFSGDKLLGGPQAGIIIGKRCFLDCIKKNPITRALRIDKLTLAALETTLRLYRDEKKAVSAVPTLRMLTQPIQVIEERAIRLLNALKNLGLPDFDFSITDQTSKAGGGALPLLELPTRCVEITHTRLSANEIESALRRYSTPIIARIENNRIILDPRTIQNDEIDTICDALTALNQEK